MNLERISSALQNYTGQEDSMYNVASVLQEELGENWTQTVFQDLQALSPALKENLNHAFNYYAATMAWNEVQTYLSDENLSRTAEIEERLPILKHWLDFFGASGLEAYNALKKRLDALPKPAVETVSDKTEDVALVPEESEVAEEETKVAPETDEPFVEPEPDDPELNSENLNTNVQKESVDAVEANAIAENEPQEERVPVDENVVFAFEKLHNQLVLLDQNQAWLAARCVQLKNIEIYAYPFYGFIVDLLRQVLKDMNAILEDDHFAAFIDTQFEGGRSAFDNKKAAIEHDIELAEQNCESAMTALISDDVDLDEIKRTLGTIDDSGSVEYVGPAPDGFELLDDETPLDENAIKQQYEKIENIDALGENKSAPEEKIESVQENTSQNAQKGVQRKLAFSLKRKKPAGDAT